MEPIVAANASWTDRSVVLAESSSFDLGDLLHPGRHLLLDNVIRIIAATNEGAVENFQTSVREIEWIRMGKHAKRDGSGGGAAGGMSGLGGGYGPGYGGGDARGAQPWEVAGEPRQLIQATIDTSVLQQIHSFKSELPRNCVRRSKMVVAMQWMRSPREFPFGSESK